MDQALPIDYSPLADLLGGKPPQDTPSTSGLDLVQVSRPAPEKVSHPVPTMGQFLAGIERHVNSSEAAAEFKAHAQGAGQGSAPGKILAPIQINRQENFSIPLNHPYLDHNLTLRSLEAKNPSYTATTAADGTHTLSNIGGLTLDLNVFGKNKKLDVYSITIKKDDSGNTTFALQVENPMPSETEKVFNTPNTLPLTYSLDSRGRLTQPTDSQLFYSLSSQSGGTLPGMVLRDAMHDAGSVAQFIEKNPAWINNILAPFMARYGEALKGHFDSAPLPPAPPMSKITKGIGQITQAVAPVPKTDAASFKIKGPGDYKETMVVDGRQRSFNVHVPASYDPQKPMPLMLMASGMSQTSAEFRSMFKSDKLSDTEGFIAVYPDSINWYDIPDLRTWDTGNGLVLPGQHAQDVQFMGNIINAAKKQLNVDPMRIYMSGLSNGGMLTYSSAASLSGTLAGIGILSSAMSGKETAPKEPLSMINIHGTADKIIPYQGLTDTPPILTDAGVPTFKPATFGTDYYRKLDGITDAPTVTKKGNQTIELAANPANGTAVEQITLDGVDHFLDNPAQRLEQTWDFLKAHPRQTAPNPSDNLAVQTASPLEKLTTVQQLEADVKQRGTIGIEQDVDNIFDAARTLASNSISPSDIFDKVSKSTHVAFDDPVSKFLQNTTLVSKKQDTVSITRKGDANIPIDVDFGIGAVKSLQIGNVSFDLAKQNGYPELKNIKGITLHAQLAGYNLASSIEDITELPDGNNGVNGRIYQATMQNPLPSWARTVLFSPKQFNVDLKFNTAMTPQIVNQNETERQLLGKNPLVNGIADEAQDLVNITNSFNVSNSIKLSSDIGITAGLAYLGLRLGGSRAKLAVGLALVAAPMAIDFIRNELAT